VYKATYILYICRNNNLIVVQSEQNLNYIIIPGKRGCFVLIDILFFLVGFESLTSIHSEKIKLNFVEIVNCFCFALFCFVLFCFVLLCYVLISIVLVIPIVVDCCFVMLCYVMLCYVMLCYVILCYVMLCYVMLCYVLLCFDLYIR
jgi:hypothetical protein